ncbi:MAG: hypothetical protein GY861_01125 [bacterium]|nr:hypothetical protein [bacterium]
MELSQEEIRRLVNWYSEARCNLSWETDDEDEDLVLRLLKEQDFRPEGF